MPESPADGPEGKKVICNMPLGHPYLLALRKGMQRIASSMIFSWKSMIRTGTGTLKAISWKWP